jgi:hypothetical protein
MVAYGKAAFPAKPRGGGVAPAADSLAPGRPQHRKHPFWPSLSKHGVFRLRITQYSPGHGSSRDVPSLTRAPTSCPGRDRPAAQPFRVAEDRGGRGCPNCRGAGPGKARRQFPHLESPGRLAGARDQSPARSASRPVQPPPSGAIRADDPPHQWNAPTGWQGPTPALCARAFAPEWPEPSAPSIPSVGIYRGWAEGAEQVRTRVRAAYFTMPRIVPWLAVLVKISDGSVQISCSDPAR